MVMMIAMTIASRGRSMKTEEIIERGPWPGARAPGSALRAPAGPGCTSLAGTDALHAIHDHMLALVKSGQRPAATVGVDWPSLIRRCCTLLSASTVKT